MVQDFAKLFEEVKTRILMNKLENYENLITYYFEAASDAIDKEDYISYTYWTTKAARCVDEYLEAINKHKDLLM